MLDVGIREMMTVFRGLKVVHVVCLWICVLIGNSKSLLIWLNLGEKVLIELWELWREKD
jgi:hypothetical protein